MHAVSVTCPSCFEEFDVPAPAAQEVPCDVDYDCEVCCRPMRIYFDEDGGEITGNAYGLGAAGVFG
ncbi:MAG: CPXCG motif-containing cysteine-rich protein [Prosthecobacter sp.]|uniref:CPXCG motif-containing cysteine-rich protein n=1 Tax=Prosthecobacter sp. TaxID=1965333 RepID=UPI001A032C4B|nr:CPXCG motif-containing cysteine-rich protein [Prosthecobacter sp.]